MNRAREGTLAEHARCRPCLLRGGAVWQPEHGLPADDAEVTVHGGAVEAGVQVVFSLKIFQRTWRAIRRNYVKLNVEYKKVTQMTNKVSKIIYFHNFNGVFLNCPNACCGSADCFDVLPTD